MAGILSGKVAMVTGASRGIGKAIALALGTEGARIVFAARSEQDRQLEGTIYRTAMEIEALGGDQFTAPNIPMDYRRIFGGQLLAQVL